MNDPGLDVQIQDTAEHVKQSLGERLSSNAGATASQRDSNPGTRDTVRKELKHNDEEEEIEEIGLSQPNRWWFTSTAFPLFAGTFGPLANLFSVCALVETWRVQIPDGSTESHGLPVDDPGWLIALNATSLTLALIANVLLLLNFAHRISYSLAQLLTIVIWYISAVLLIIPLAMTKQLTIYPTSNHAFSQSYYYAIIAATLYTIISSLLVFNVLGAYKFHAYPPSFNSLTIPQRTVMLQTMSFVSYVALGAGIFARIEGWGYCDGVYWADYTLLTVGIGTDFPLETNLGRALLIPYAVCGIITLGLIIDSVRGLVLERAKIKVIHRALALEREKWIKHAEHEQIGEWRKREFEVMRDVEVRAVQRRKWWSLGLSFSIFLFVWCGGAGVFWFSEEWTYFESLYFAYTTLLTIGYGDFYPQSNSGKAFFVVWSLIAVPTMTTLISNMDGTVLGWVRRGVMWVGKRTVLPERTHKHVLSEKKTGRMKAIRGEEQVGTDLEDGGSTRRLRGDVERLGGAEDAQSQRGGLEARLAHEIKRLVKDVGSKPEKRYEWEQWREWLRLLGEGEGIGEMKRSNNSHGGGDMNRCAEDVELTWLADNGPLFSSMSETEWVLGQLSQRLEEVLENKFAAQEGNL